MCLCMGGGGTSVFSKTTAIFSQDLLLCETAQFCLGVSLAILALQAALGFLTVLQMSQCEASAWAFAL